MPAGIYDTVLEQGATFTRQLTWKDSAGGPVNLTGYTAKMQLRPSASSSVVLLELTETSGITLGGAAGTIIIKITDEQTDTLAPGKVKYDLKLTSPAGDDTRLLEGSLKITPAVTR